MNKTIKRSDLVEILKSKVGLTDAIATETVVTLFGEMKNALRDGDGVDIYGFGKFNISERAERQGKNPLTGEDITIQASKVVKFKPAKALKDAVKN